ncbi:hypothetical protein GG681_08350 [Epibacterium sp. SM1969]|uniref:Uncharacterized protein n=1 Tax=Tritonibacter aquimaris TaxID=2663379 RepID=A0A844AXL3_9RHOB|nr:hypothetical protein [Tritonibacter aquimaris]MQY42652.1 hypothetical protein [Tritonibacter aquimaris]
MARPVLPVLLLSLALAAACTRVPEIEDQLTDDLRNAPYPELIPLDGVVEDRAAPSEEAQELEAELARRAARLKARAAALKAAEI